MHKSVWFSSRVKIYNKFIGQLDFIDQSFFIKTWNWNLGEIKIDGNNEKDNLIPFLNLEWNCNQRIQKSIKITLRKDKFVFFIENCLIFSLINHKFQSTKNTNFLLIKLHESRNWTNFSNHAILSNFDILRKSREKYILLCIHEERINYLSCLSTNWLPKIL